MASRSMNLLRHTAFFRFAVAAALATLLLMTGATAPLRAQGLDQKPVLGDDTIVTRTPGQPITISSLLQNDFDPEGEALSIIGVTNGAGGDARVSTGNVVVYSPGAGFTGTDQFQYFVRDTVGNV